MEFCSSHVYIYSEYEDEAISNDEFDYDCNKITDEDSKSSIAIASDLNKSRRADASLYNSSFIIHKDDNNNNYNNSQAIGYKYRFCLPDSSIALSSIEKERYY